MAPALRALHVREPSPRGQSDERLSCLVAPALRALADRGVTRLMVEGGGRLISAFLKADLVDRLVWFRAPSVIGGDGIPAVSTMGVQVLDGAANFVKVSARPAGDDLVETYVRKH